MQTRRYFIPGDSWLYYKIYTGTKSADLLLTEVIKPVSELFMAKSYIDKWHFIRYSDPKFHIRLRFHIKESQFISDIMILLANQLDPYVSKDIIWNIELDTYQRELERYGNDTMELSETLFNYNSELIVNFLNLIEGDQGDEIRWLFGMRSTLTLLEAFQYTDKEKLNLIESLKNGFAAEFGSNKFLKKQLSTKYRSQKNKISNFMQVTAKAEEWLPIIRLLENYNEKVSSIAGEIIKNVTKSSNNLSLDRLMSSYIHMHLNRLFRSKNRANEMVCYDFLFLYYNSYCIRKMKGKN